MSRQPTQDRLLIGLAGFVLGFGTAIIVMVLFFMIAANYHQQSPRRVVSAAPSLEENIQP